MPAPDRRPQPPPRKFGAVRPTPSLNSMERPFVDLTPPSSVLSDPTPPCSVTSEESREGSEAETASVRSSTMSTVTGSFVSSDSQYTGTSSSTASPYGNTRYYVVPGCPGAKRRTANGEVLI